MDASQPTALVLDDVTVRGERGGGVKNASLDIAAGEVVGVWGRRRSGRSTLLRVAAGIERPDSGEVTVDGRNVWRDRDARRDVAVWHTAFPADHGRTVLRQVGISARRGRRPVDQVRNEAAAALKRVGADDWIDVDPQRLDHAEAVRVGLARALVMRPSVLVLDEPLSGLGVLEADRVLELLVRIAHEDRIAVLLTAAEVAQLGGIDRHLSIGNGTLRGATTPLPAEVLKLRRA